MWRGKQQDGNGTPVQGKWFCDLSERWTLDPAQATLALAGLTLATSAEDAEGRGRCRVRAGRAWPRLLCDRIVPARPPGSG